MIGGGGHRQIQSGTKIYVQTQTQKNSAAYIILSKMARYDVVDEGVIEADLSTVFKACMDDFAGGRAHVQRESP